MTELHRLSQFIKERTPIKFKVRCISFSKKSHTVGDCGKTPDNTFIIRIEKALPKDEQLGILLHEWAHIISWKMDSEDHGVCWQAAMMKAVDLWMDWLKHNLVE